MKKKKKEKKKPLAVITLLEQHGASHLRGKHHMNMTGGFLQIWTAVTATDTNQAITLLGRQKSQATTVGSEGYGHGV